MQHCVGNVYDNGLESLNDKPLTEPMMTQYPGTYMRD